MYFIITDYIRDGMPGIEIDIKELIVRNERSRSSFQINWIIIAIMIFKRILSVNDNLLF